MNTRAPFDTGQCCTGNNDAIVDHLLGNAYQVVKFVAMRMPFIKTVSDNIESVIAIATALDKLKALEEKLPELLALRDKLNQLMEIYAHLNELLLISTNMNALLSVHDNLANIQLIATNISQLQTCAANIQSIATVSANIGSVNTVATDIAQVKVVAADIVAVRAVAADIASVKNVSTNMPVVKNVSDNMPKLTAIHAELPQLSANSADIAAFKSGTGSTKIGHTPASGGATTVDAALKGLRTDVDGKAAKANTLGGYGITDAYTKTEGDGRYAAKATTLNGYGITDAYTKTEADNKLTQKVDKTAALGGGGDPTDAKASRVLATWYKNTTTRPLTVSASALSAAAGGLTVAGYLRKTPADSNITAAYSTVQVAGAGAPLTVNIVVPPGWEYQVDATGASGVNHWLEY